jgi:hypothetical protein
MEINWTYGDKDFTEQDIGDNYGFVYVITHLTTGKKYIGKKFFYSVRTKITKGKRKKIKTFSDWQTYYGSNLELQNDIQLYGKEYFKREILYLCKSKGECGYIEAKEQFDRCVLETTEYYNAWIMVKVRKTHIKAFNERVLANIKD